MEQDQPEILLDGFFLAVEFQGRGLDEGRSGGRSHQVDRIKMQHVEPGGLDVDAQGQRRHVLVEPSDLVVAIPTPNKHMIGRKVKLVVGCGDCGCDGCLGKRRIHRSSLRHVRSNRAGSVA